MAGDTLSGFEVAKLMARMNAKSPTGGPVGVPGASQAVESAIASGRPLGAYTPAPQSPFPGLNDFMVAPRTPPGYLPPQPWGSGPEISEVPMGFDARPSAYDAAGARGRAPAGEGPGGFKVNALRAGMNARSPAGGPMRVPGSAGVVESLLSEGRTPGYSLPLDGMPTATQTVRPRVAPGFNVPPEPGPPPLDSVAAGMGRRMPGMERTAAGMGQAGFEANAARTGAQAASQAGGFVDDLGRVARGFNSGVEGLGSLASAIASNPLVNNPLTRTVARVAAPVGLAVGAYNTGSEMLDANSDPRRRFSAASDAFNAGNYGDAAKNAYYGVGDVVGSFTNLKGLAQMLGRPTPLTPEQQRAEIAKMAQGASLLDDNDMSNPIKNAARYEQIKAQREQRLQNEPTMNVRTTDGRDMRLLADEVRNSPLRAEIMRNGVPSGGHMTVGNAQAGGDAAANDPVARMRAYGRAATQMIADGTPPGVVNALIGDGPNYENIDAGRGLRSAQAAMYRGERPLKPAEQAQELALKDEMINRQLDAVMRSETASPEQRQQAQQMLTARKGNTRNLLRIVKPNDLNGLDLYDMQRQTLLRQQMGIE